MGTVTRMNSTARRVFLEDGRALEAEMIVVALGSVLAPPAHRIPGVEGALGVKFDHEAHRDLHYSL